MSGPVRETVLTSLQDGVARITLNRPAVRNALSRTMVRELGEARAAFEADPATLVALSDDAPEGVRAFCDKRDPEWTGR